MKFGGFFDHFKFLDHPWPAVTDLSHHLDSLWSNRGQISAEKHYKCLRYKTVQFAQHHMDYSTSGWTWVAFLAKICLRITLGRLFPTYHVPWPAFGVILDRLVERNLHWLETNLVQSTYVNLIWVSTLMADFTTVLTWIICNKFAHRGNWNNI